MLYRYVHVVCIICTLCTEFLKKIFIVGMIRKMWSKKTVFRKKRFSPYRLAVVKSCGLQKKKFGLGWDPSLKF